MREIKFRAWNKRVRGFVPVDHTASFTHKEDGVLNIMDGIELMQYTGLKDKNGVQIFEGDIVRILYTDWMSQHLGNEKQRAMTLEDYLISISKIDTVVFRDLSFQLENGNRLSCGKHGFIEVIGNMCENPELLEGNK